MNRNWLMMAGAGLVGLGAGFLFRRDRNAGTGKGSRG